MAIRTIVEAGRGFAGVEPAAELLSSSADTKARMSRTLWSAESAAEEAAGKAAVTAE